MRYFEISRLYEDASKAKMVSDQNSKSVEALRRLRSRQADVADRVIAAQSLAPGPEKARRLRSADRSEQEAKRVFNDKQNKCHDRITDILSN